MSGRVGRRALSLSLSFLLPKKRQSPLRKKNVSQKPMCVPLATQRTHTTKNESETHSHLYYPRHRHCRASCNIDPFGTHEQNDGSIDARRRRRRRRRDATAACLHTHAARARAKLPVR